MSQFTLEGVPEHAYDLLCRLRDKVAEPDGERWSEALEALLEGDNPMQAKAVLESLRVYTGKIIGVISAVTGDGGSGVVSLTPSVDKFSTGVISPDTKGRISLMNLDPGGRLKRETQVVITRWQKGPESLRILEIALPG